MSKTAMYAFSGDPITNGHIDIIKRASKIFDTLIVGIGVNPDKKYTFSLNHRKYLAETALDELDNVKVISFEGLLIDSAYEHGVDVIIRGVRNSGDFDYEEVLHNVNQSQELGIDTLCMFSNPKLNHVSSSTVKAIEKESGFIHDYVPLCVKDAVERRISARCVIGLTGSVGSGKSYIASKIKEIYDDVVHIDLDKIAHDILNSLNEAGYVKVRQKIVDMWGDSVVAEDGFINRKVLGSLIFGDEFELDELNSIMREPLLVRIRKEMRKVNSNTFNQIVLIDGALLVEAGLNHLCNNNMIILNVKNEAQIQRLVKRGYDGQQIERRINSQYTFEEKVYRMKVELEKHNFGTLLTVDNSEHNDNVLESIKKYIDDILRGVQINEIH